MRCTRLPELLGAALLAFVSLVEGENCPAPIDVELRVRAILQLAPEQELNESFLVQRREAGLYVALQRADSTLIGERTLPTSGSCDELAQAAAVVLSAWLTDVHPDFAGALPGAELAPPAPLETPRSFSALVDPLPRPLPALVRPAAPAEPTHSLRFLFGAGGDLAGGSVSPAAYAGADFGASRTGFAVSLRSMVTMPRQQPLAPGRVNWWRWPLGVGPALRIERGAVRVVISTGPAAAWLRLVGESFDRTTSNGALRWGGFFDAVVAGRGRVSPFGALCAHIYPGSTKAYVSASPRLEWELPSLSMTLLAGVQVAP